MDGAWAALLGAIVGGLLAAGTTALFAQRSAAETRRVAARLALSEIERVRAIVQESLGRGVWWPPLELRLGPEVLAPLAGVEAEEWSRILSARTSIWAIETIRRNNPPGEMAKRYREELIHLPDHLRKGEAVLEKWADLGDARRQLRSSAGNAD